MIVEKDSNIAEELYALPSLPDEILDIIFTHLNTKDICLLRCTNKKMDELLYKSIDSDKIFPIIQLHRHYYWITRKILKTTTDIEHHKTNENVFGQFKSLSDTVLADFILKKNSSNTAEAKKDTIVTIFPYIDPFLIFPRGWRALSVDAAYYKLELNRISNIKRLDKLSSAIMNNNDQAIIDWYKCNALSDSIVDSNLRKLQPLFIIGASIQKKSFFVSGANFLYHYCFNFSLHVNLCQNNYNIIKENYTEYNLEPQYLGQNRYAILAKRHIDAYIHPFLIQYSRITMGKIREYQYNNFFIRNIIAISNYVVTLLNLVKIFYYCNHAA